jgi:hypothetical protein
VNRLAGGHQLAEKILYNVQKNIVDGTISTAAGEKLCLLSFNRVNDIGIDALLVFLSS